jgi:hypothetical protein
MCSVGSGMVLTIGDLAGAHSSRCSPPRQHSSPVRVAYGHYARSRSSCRVAGLVGNGPRHRRPSVAAVL